MAAEKVIAVCIGDESSIDSALLHQEYLGYHPEHKLEFFIPPSGEQNMENLAMHLARAAGDAEILVAVQKGVHPIEGAEADETHIYFSKRVGFLREFYPTRGQNPPYRMLAKDLVMISRRQSDSQIH